MLYFHPAYKLFGRIFPRSAITMSDLGHYYFDISFVILIAFMSLMCFSFVVFFLMLFMCAYLE